jgi:5-methylcytosine-specific restriction endonuclease McrA
MRELVVQRDGHCVFPGCTLDARACDLDHIAPYRPPGDGGPPGQTCPENLAALCRRHHRLKTFASWTYRRLPDGDYEWTDPYATLYVVTAGR